jgi:hypothetical protein
MQGINGQTKSPLTLVHIDLISRPTYEIYEPHIYLKYRPVVDR